MIEQHVFTYWTVGLATATALACLAAALLIANLRMAQKIERSTDTALEVIKRIRDRSELEAGVEQANQAACQLNAAAGSFLARAEAVVKTKRAAVVPNGNGRKESGR